MTDGVSVLLSNTLRVPLPKYSFFLYYTMIFTKNKTPPRLNLGGVLVGNEIILPIINRSKQF